MQVRGGDGLVIKNKKILLTGGLGFIGSWLSESLCQENEVSVFDNGRRNALQFAPDSINKKINIISGDILDQTIVQKIVKDKDIIIHMAAIAGASFYEKDPLLTLSVNLFGTENILKSSINTSVEKIIIFSSSEIYGIYANGVVEDSPSIIGPSSQGRWSYAVSKLAAEHLSLGYFKKYNMPVTIIRPFNIFGPRQVGEGAVANMMKNAILNKKITVTGNGQQKRAWCYITDLVKAVELICMHDKNGQSYNIGNPDANVTILELAKKIQFLVKDAELVFTNSVGADILTRSPNITKAQKELGFEIKYGLDEGLKLAYEWYLKNINVLMDK